LSDLESLFLVVALLYLGECGIWVPQGGLAFVATLGRSARIAFPSRILATREGGVVWRNPLSLPGRLFRCGGASFDGEAISGRLAELRAASRAVRAWGIALFLFFFALAPAVAWTEGLARSGLFLLALLLALVSGTILSFLRAHRTLFPQDSRERRSRAIFFAVAPLGAIRAADALSRDLLAEFHPVAVAKAVCTPEAHLDLARRALLELRFGPSAGDRSAGHATLRALENHLREAGINPERLLEPPTPSDPNCRSYCPRCRNQYVVSEGGCADCAGVALLPL
jgi:hypothetical protein